MCKRLFVLLTFFVVLGLVIPNVIFADVIEVRVAAGEDDSEEDVATGAIDLGSSDLEITEEGEPALNQLVGMRFNGIAIPQGAVITSAYIQFQVDETDVPGDNRPGTKFIKGEASDNAATFTTADFDISSRPTTAAEASWDWPEWLTEDEEGPDQQTSDISAVIQEIVDRPGWATGNSLVLIITGSGENAAESFDGEAEAAPLLTVEFDAPAAIPDGWANQDINTTGGSAAESDGTWTISADGADVWGAADQFHYVYKELTGDAVIVARVVDNGTGSNAWAKGGVMIRQSTEAGSTHAIMAITGGEGGGGAFQWRPEADGDSSSAHDTAAGMAPGYWVKLERVGNDFAGSYSADGVTWIQQGDAQIIEMEDPVLIGLFVTSHAEGEIRSYTFDDVSVVTMFDVTAPGDVVQGVPNDGDWPGGETPDLAFDDDTSTKYLHFKGDFDPDPNTGGSGLQITPAVGATIVTGLTLTTANDVPGRDPISFELSGSNDSIDGPYTLIASGDIVDFAQEAEWPRFTKNETEILFENDKVYAHYQLLFTAIRGPVGGSVNSMQIAEVELLGVPGPDIIWVSGFYDDNADGAPDDQEWVDILTAAGYVVDYNPGWLELDEAQVATLNAADLVIVSRNSNSGDYATDDTEVALWNSVTTPIILSSTHIVRSSRWKWVDSTSILNLAPAMMDLADGSQIPGMNAEVGPSSFIDAVVGNGTVLATGDGLPWIFEFEAGVEYYDGAGQTAGGPRVFFTAGTQEDTAADPIIGRGEMNLTPEGLALFMDTVDRFVNPPPTVAWVSYHAADDEPHADAAAVGFTQAPDIEYTDLLKAQGYNVVRVVTSQDPDVEFLNTMDLVIISRTASSGHYSGSGATAWNSVTAPMINLNGYTLRNSRMGFTTGGTMVDTIGDITLAVTDPGHPIFAGISITDGIMDNLYAEGAVPLPTDETILSRGISVNNDPAEDEGTVLATVATVDDPTVGGMVIAEWPAGATMENSSGSPEDVLGGPRLVFLTGSREPDGVTGGQAAALYDLYEDGTQMFLNAVDYMLNLN